jgi:hypothetical protein
MAIRPLATATMHSRMVRTHARLLRAQGYRNVRADDIGWPGGAPLRIGGLIPDVTGVAPNGVLVVVEVETCDSFGLAETRAQWLTFSRYTQRVGACFRVLAPLRCAAAAQVQATAWGIPVAEWWQDEAA